MITLSHKQSAEIAAAGRAGWKMIQSFYNPNSYNTVQIWTKVLWPTLQDYRKAETEGYKGPKWPVISRQEPEYEPKVLLDEEVKIITGGQEEKCTANAAT
jgi:hypothetical protein